MNSKLNECLNMDTYKLYGELIIANLYKYNTNCDSIMVNNYYTNSYINIPLDKTISPNRNAEKYFKKYNKLKNTCVIVTKQKDTTLLEISYIESLLKSIQESSNIQDLEKIKEEILNDKVLPPLKKSTKYVNNTYSNDSFNFTKYMVNGFTVLVGKNNKQNDLITFRIANNNDIWLHLKDYPSCHVVIRTNNKLPDENTIYECAKIVVQNSKIANSTNVKVDYTFIKNVKKPTGAKSR